MSEVVTIPDVLIDPVTGAEEPGYPPGLEPPLDAGVDLTFPEGRNPLADMPSTETPVLINETLVEGDVTQDGDHPATAAEAAEAANKIAELIEQTISTFPVKAQQRLREARDNAAANNVSEGQFLMMLLQMQQKSLRVRSGVRQVSDKEVAARRAKNKAAKASRKKNRR